MFSEVDREIERVRDLVAARFPVYDTRITPQAVQFLVTVDPATMEQKFEELRLDLVPKNYIPFLTRQAGEHAILVQRRPPQKFLGRHVNLLLLIVTLATTTFAGAVNWGGYDGIDWLTAEAFAKGSVFFTLPLLAILGIHEMGHYVVARRYRVHASLPFFIPAPGTFLGTFGAMISMRDPIPSRRALLDIGAAGPVLGLLASIPITLIGLHLMAVDPRPVPINTGGGIQIELPLLYVLLAAFLPVPEDVLLHPTAFAGWVGLFVTALNLLPAGQLDGGHVARAVLGDRGKYLSYAAIVFMLLLGLRYFGWFIIAVFILFLGARHPPPLNDLTRLDGKRYALAASAAAVMLLSFVAIPVDVVPPEADIQFAAIAVPDVPVDRINATVRNGTVATFTFAVVNAGNVRTNVNVSLDVPWSEELNLSVGFADVAVGNLTVPVESGNVSFFLNSTEVANVTLSLNATDYAFVPSQWSFTVKARVAAFGVRPFDTELAVNLRVVA